jgi:hypothetical protein
LKGFRDIFLVKFLFNGVEVVELVQNRLAGKKSIYESISKWAFTGANGLKLDLNGGG